MQAQAQALSRSQLGVTTQGTWGPAVLPPQVPAVLHWTINDIRRATRPPYPACILVLAVGSGLIVLSGRYSCERYYGVLYMNIVVCGLCEVSQVDLTPQPSPEPAAR